jgi:hypothetical protein
MRSVSPWRAILAHASSTAAWLTSVAQIRARGAPKGERDGDCARTGTDVGHPCRPVSEQLDGRVDEGLGGRPWDHHLARRAQ